jgi:hypothetical protein
MKRVFSNRLVALAAGFCLRLYFVLKFSANSGDTVLYEQIATNWLKHHVYAMTVGDQITPVDLRMPGYPAFLAIVYALTGRTGAEARLWVMLAQIGVDLLSCLVIARLAALLAYSSEDSAPNERAYFVALWLAALCPFTANYAAVPLTEVFATFWTALGFCAILLALRRVDKPNFLVKGSHLPLSRSVEYAAMAAGLIVGVGTLFRPEAPMLLIAAVLVFGGIFFLRKNFRRWIWVCLSMALGCLVMLSPWAVRNMVTLDEPQFLAPKNSNLPGELVPYGFMAWEKTWLYRVRECYLVPWRLNEEAIFVEDMPARAFDTPEEKQRVAAILEPYNNDLMLTPEEDEQFSQLAKERNARHPLRTYLGVPAARAITMWFTPRIELLPISGHVFPLAQMREDDPVDQEVTSLFFVLNIFYVSLGIWGGVRLWRSNPAASIAIIFLALFTVLRTAFLTTLETAEPRYVLVCFPALIALGAQAFARRFETQ